MGGAGFASGRTGVEATAGAGERFALARAIDRIVRAAGADDRADCARTNVAKRKKVPKRLAILDEDFCTGCEACVTVCPVDCIDHIDDMKNPDYVAGVCRIDLERCIGCSICEPICPWDAIRMVPTEQVRAAESAGGSS